MIVEQRERAAGEGMCGVDVRGVLGSRPLWMLTAAEGGDC